VSDRELLELAAKAAGTYYVEGESWDENAGWNPLTDDGDALRLAVKLKFQIDIYYGEIASGEEGERHQTLIGDDPDPCAATRSAIVRAAAEIGRNMT
jgi:hypothetical protein